MNFLEAYKEGNTNHQTGTTWLSNIFSFVDGDLQKADEFFSSDMGGSSFVIYHDSLDHELNQIIPLLMQLYRVTFYHDIAIVDLRDGNFACITDLSLGQCRSRLSQNTLTETAHFKKSIYHNIAHQMDWENRIRSHMQEVVSLQNKIRSNTLPLNTFSDVKPVDGFMNPIVIGETIVYMTDELKVSISVKTFEITATNNKGVKINLVFGKLTRRLFELATCYKWTEVMEFVKKQLIKEGYSFE